MKYSDYTTDQIVSPLYKEVTNKLLSLAPNDDIKKKIEQLLYEGGFDNFSVNGSFHMKKEVLYKNNPLIESEKRLNMAYLLLTNPQMIEVIEKTNGHFFHGTNANALPSILKYGINSVNASIENNITVTTGEEWSRINGKRNFVSLTDCLDVALSYSNMTPNDNNSKNSLLNFGVLIGSSFEDMTNLAVSGVNSDISEIGVIGNLPLDHIKFLAVPDDKVEFVKKLVGQKNIEVISMDLSNVFFQINFRQKLNILEQGKEYVEQLNPSYPTYFKDDIKPLVNERKTSKIKEIFSILKANFVQLHKQTNDKNINERS